MAQDWIENKLVGDIKEGVWDSRVPRNMVAIWGFPANSDREDYNRLYLSLNFDEYLEFPHSGLVHVEDAGGPDNPFSGSMVWLRRDTPVEHVRVSALDLQRGFLQGGIAGSYLGGVQNAGVSSAHAGTIGGGGTLLCTGGDGVGSMICGVNPAGSAACGGAGTLICTGGHGGQTVGCGG